MNLPVLRRASFLALLMLCACGQVCHGQLTNTLPLTASPLPDTGTSILRVFGSLAVVVGLFLGGVWCFKNWQRLVAGKGRNPRLQILEVKPLGGRHALYLVAYEHQRLLIASSPGGVNLITHLPESDEVPVETVPAPAGFAQVLQRVAGSHS